MWLKEFRLMEEEAMEALRWKFGRLFVLLLLLMMKEEQVELVLESKGKLVINAQLVIKRTK